MSAYRFGSIIFAAGLSQSCAANDVDHRVASIELVNEVTIDQVIEAPHSNDGAIVTTEIFPFDNGFSESFPFCLERCLPLDREQTPFVVFTSPGRFAGSDGTAGVTIRMVFNAGCYIGSAICVDLRFGRFTELR